MRTERSTGEQIQDATEAAGEQIQEATEAAGEQIQEASRCWRTDPRSDRKCQGKGQRDRFQRTFRPLLNAWKDSLALRV